MDFLAEPSVVFGAIGAVGGLCRTLDWYLTPDSPDSTPSNLQKLKVARNLLFGAVGGALLGTSAVTAFAAGAFFELTAVGIVYDGIVKGLGGALVARINK